MLADTSFTRIWKKTQKGPARLWCIETKLWGKTLAIKWEDIIDNKKKDKLPLYKIAKRTWRDNSCTQKYIQMAKSN